MPSAVQNRMHRQPQAHSVNFQRFVLNRCRQELQLLKQRYLSGQVSQHQSIHQLQGLQLQLLRTGSFNLCNAIDMIIQKIENEDFSNHGSFTVAQPTGIRLQRRGRPKIMIDVDLFKMLRSQRFSFKKISTLQLLGKCSVRTLKRVAKENNLQMPNQQISEEDLEVHVRRVNSMFPNSGSREVTRMLANGVSGTRVCTSRGRAANVLKKVDPKGTANRWAMCIPRAKYTVPRANYIWHLDTHHSLKKFGIYITGGIDGKSRTITFMLAADNNTAETSFIGFLNGVKNFGLPSLIRTDHGSEYFLTREYMDTVHAEIRGIAGASVHNERIERLWRDVYAKVAAKYYTVFHYMENEGKFKRNRTVLMWIVRQIFLPLLNRDLCIWANAANSSPLSTERSRTRLQLFITSMLTNDQNSRAGVRFLRNRSLKVPVEFDSGVLSEFNVPPELCRINADCAFTGACPLPDWHKDQVLEIIRNTDVTDVEVAEVTFDLCSEFLHTTGLI